MHIVGMHAHAAHHRHNHPHGNEACDGAGIVKDHGHAHSHAHAVDDEADVRHVVVSQVY
jgi:zinc transporter 1/2/3